MHIAPRTLGPDQPPYVIAEIGVNHDGSPQKALELTRAAADAGADAIKLQLFQADRLMSKASRLAAYQHAAGEHDPLAMLRRLELSIEHMEPVVRLAHTLGVHAIVSVFSVELVPVAEHLPWDAYKSASPDLINRPLLEALVQTGRPLIVSTGAATLDEVRRAAEWLAPHRPRVAWLQCVSSYPTPRAQAALGGIGALADALNAPVGYSDHTPDVETASDAIAAGACILEKHFTLDRSAQGPDHAASLTPDQFRRYAFEARSAWRSLAAGSPRPIFAPREKALLPCERDVRAVSRQSLVTARPLPAGHRLRREDLTIKRPGTGLEPFRLPEIVGRTLAQPVEADVPLLESNLAPAAIDSPGVRRVSA